MCVCRVPIVGNNDDSPRGGGGGLLPVAAAAAAVCQEHHHPHHYSSTHHTEHGTHQYPPSWIYNPNNPVQLEGYTVEHSVIPINKNMLISFLHTSP